MDPTQPGPHGPISSRPARDVAPRRLLVTASVVIFAIRDWSLWVLLRDGPWGPPMRLVLGNEAVTDAVVRTIETLLIWHDDASLIQLKAVWQEQQVSVWNSTEQGAAISLIHSVLLRANRDELRPNLHRQPVPSLHVRWVAIAEIEAGRYPLDAEVEPTLLTALHTLRSQIQRDPEIVLRYLADMASMGVVSALAADADKGWRVQEHGGQQNKQTRSLEVVKAPARGDGVLTLAEAALLYKAFFHLLSKSISPTCADVSSLPATWTCSMSSVLCAVVNLIGVVSAVRIVILVGNFFSPLSPLVRYNRSERDDPNHCLPRRNEESDGKSHDWHGRYGLYWSVGRAARAQIRSTSRYLW
ncbi:MAG: hypothetical protein ACRDHZ_25000, partial [Ktedonobacteraceae bacterium]